MTAYVMYYLLSTCITTISYPDKSDNIENLYWRFVNGKTKNTVNSEIVNGV